MECLNKYYIKQNMTFRLPCSCKECEPEQKFNNQPLNLDILAEEAAEIIQAKSKIIRFGIDDYHPKNKLPNREKLEEEIGHLMKIVDILVYHGTVTREGIEKGREGKIDRLNKWYKVQED